MGENSENPEPISELIGIGSELTGSVAGSVIGSLLAGPFGAIVGGATSTLLTRALQRIGQDIRNRVLSPREEVRIGETLKFAIQKIQDNLNDGQSIREDEFFRGKLQERAAAEEILEGVLIASQREHEEKKLKFYGNLVANIAFHPEVSREQANLLIKQGANISYYQMCLLNLVVNKHSFKLRENDYILLDNNGQNYSDLSVNETFTLQEIYDLFLKRLLDFKVDGLILGKPIGDLEYINPQTLELKSIGLQLYRLMELHEISENDIKSIAQILSDHTS